MQHNKILIGAATLFAGFALAACGSDGGTNSGNPAPPAASSGTTIVAMAVPGGDARLVDSSGRTLYFADVEVGGDIRCIDACANFWLPLTLPDGSTPTKDAALTGTLTLVARPDGRSQVAYDGRPLYTFAQDTVAGQATGNGFTDEFNGTTFVWHVATVTGAAPAPTVTETQLPDYPY